MYRRKEEGPGKYKKGEKKKKVKKNEATKRKKKRNSIRRRKRMIDAVTMKDDSSHSVICLKKK